jgi:hypothetical protein
METVHELGHLLNLGHCPNPRCVMHFSNSLRVLLAGIEAKVDGRMSTRLWETANGATVWSNSSWGDVECWRGKLRQQRPGERRLFLPNGKKSEIFIALVRALNGDLWPTHEKHKVKE